MFIKSKPEILQDERWIEWDATAGEGGEVAYFVHCYTLNRTNHNLAKYGSDYPYLKEGETPEFKEIATASFDFRDMLFNQETQGFSDPDAIVTWAVYLNEVHGIGLDPGMTDLQLINECPNNTYITIR